MAKQVLAQKKKKKKWYPIYAPKIFNNQLIGESLVASPEDLKGKYINANLSTITNDMKKQKINIKLKVTSVKDGKGHADVIGLQLIQTFVKRLIRRGRTKIDDSFTAKTKEGIKVRIKPLIITNTNCVRSTASQIRMEARKQLKETISKQPFITSVEDIINGKIQRSLKEQLSKIFPLRSVDIRVFTQEGTTTQPTTNSEEETTETPTEEAQETTTQEETAKKEATTEEAPKEESAAEDKKNKE